MLSRQFAKGAPGSASAVDCEFRRGGGGDDDDADDDDGGGGDDDDTVTDDSDDTDDDDDGAISASAPLWQPRRPRTRRNGGQCRSDAEGGTHEVCPKSRSPHWERGNESVGVQSQRCVKTARLGRRFSRRVLEHTRVSQALPALARRCGQLQVMCRI